MGKVLPQLDVTTPGQLSDRAIEALAALLIALEQDNGGSEGELRSTTATRGPRHGGASNSPA